MGKDETDEARATYHVYEAAMQPLHLLASHLWALRKPGAYFSTLSLALRTGAPGWRARLYQFFYFAEAAVFARHLKARGATHLHAHFADACATLAMLTARLAEIPFSYTLHGPAELFEPQKWAHREKARNAMFVACISHFARSQAMYFSDPADWAKLRIVHCGVEPARYYGPECDQQGPFKIVYVGRLTSIKGARILLEAFTIARNQVPDLQLTLVGDGEDRSALEALAQPFGDAVRFLGYRSQEEVARHLSQANALVLSSFAEGVPVVLMEAMACKLPVIAPQVGGIAELVQDGVNGYLVPPGDPEVVAQRIVALARAPELCIAMGHAGRQRVVAEFDSDVEAARIANLFLNGPCVSLRPDPLELYS